MKMEFENKTLEKLFRGYKWARNNSIQMLGVTISRDVLDYVPKSSAFTFQPVLHQFQCLASTTDTYYRQLTKSEIQDFGVLVKDNSPIPKNEIPTEDLTKLLKQQLIDLETLFKSFTDKDFEDNVKSIQSICNHEYLHQGQLLLLMREAGVDVPERFKSAFAL